MEKKIHGIIGHSIIYGYADADFASDIDSRKSTTGWIFMYNGGAISWRSSQQSITALSTSEAEYMALSDAAKEARSLLKLNVSLDNNSPNNIKLFEDNRGCEKWTRTLSEPNRTKQGADNFNYASQTLLVQTFAHGSWLAARLSTESRSHIVWGKAPIRRHINHPSRATIP